MTKKTDSNNKALGNKGEALAVKYLVDKGFHIICKNFRYRRLEIDIIASYNNILVFVEVKTRSNLTYGNPEEFVDQNKALLIVQAADEYIHQVSWDGNIRFDIIAVNLQPGGFHEITHFEDAFY